MAVDYRTHDGVAVITINQPPVNGLGHAVREAIVEGVERALADEATIAIVLTGGGKGFSGGADITEFNTPMAMREPALSTVITIIEESTKPVIAAIHGFALGGGLELALGAHYRIGMPDVQIALPEVKLGILPGAGGTQRLPRAIGLEAALNMIVSGEVVKSEALAHTSLFDKIVVGDLVDQAVLFARNAARKSGPYPRVRDRDIPFPDAQDFVKLARKAVLVDAGHFPAPYKCIDAIEYGARHGFDAGLKYECESFLALLDTIQSRALRHAFFGERAAAKIPDVPSDMPVRDVRRVGVIGAGTMGGGIAMNFVNLGLPVILLETTQEGLDRGLAMIRKNYELSVSKGKLTTQALQSRMALIRPTLSYDDLRNADLIIEAVYEDLDVKKAVFRQLDDAAKPGAILASNTSTLDLNEIAAFTRRPQDVVGMHFFSPANVMKLLEVVRGEKTAKDVLATVMQLARKIKKTAVVSGVCDGFIGNRMVEQYLRQALFMLEEGALPRQIDEAIEKFGVAMGPFRMSDLAGNDIGWAIRKRRYVEQPDLVYSKIADRLCETGRFGQKTDGGWYDYKPGDRTAHRSAQVDEMIIRYSKEMGVMRREISDDEIVERLVFALVNEGAKILEEGIASKASDIDMVYLTGYGFPLYRGGPMMYADTVGLRNVERAISRYRNQNNGDGWVPAPLLSELAAAGKGFNDKV
jgi:3-hydroxyacyl-CoA dehydrogenase